MQDDRVTMVRQSTAAGCRFARVRVKTLPLNDYSRFLVWASHSTADAGEDIRYLDRQHAANLPNHDYWLFDSRLLVRMHFDDNDNRFIRAEVINDPAEIVQHNHWRDVARHHAVPQEDFASQQNVERLERSPGVARSAYDSATTVEEES